MTMMSAAATAVLAGFAKTVSAVTSITDYVGARVRAAYVNDQLIPFRTSLQNTAVQQLYHEFLGEPLGEKSEQLLHTSYTDRSQSLGKYGSIPPVLTVTPPGIITVYKDTAAGVVTVVANVVDRSSVSLEIFSMSGRKVYSLNAGMVNVGTHSLKIRTAGTGLHHGVFSFVLRVNGMKSVRQAAI